MSTLYLQALVQEWKAAVKKMFPKKCTCCEMEFETLEDFLARTTPLNYEAHLLHDLSSDRSITDISRNCPQCGSTLMVIISERRDLSPNGIALREKFDQFFLEMQARGMSKDQARVEFRKLIIQEIGLNEPGR